MDTAPSATSPRPPHGAHPADPAPDGQHIMMQGGQVFWVGSPSIGQGTQGLGSDALASERKMHQEGLQAYFKNRDAVVREREAKAMERLRVLEAEQAKSARVKMMEAREQHEEENARMIEQRKRHEEAAKAERRAKADLKNAEIHAAKERQRRDAVAAKERREEQQRRTIETIRQQRQEMLELQAEEREAQAEADRLHIFHLRQQHAAAKARAAEEAEERWRHKVDVIRHVRMEQRQKEEARDERMQAIVHLKGDSIVTAKADTKRRLLRSRAEREEARYDDIHRRTEERKERDLSRAESAVARRQHTDESAAELRAATEAARQEHEERKRQQFDVKQQRARRQRETSEAAMEEQRRHNEREREQYVRQMRGLVDRSHKGPDDDGARQRRERAEQYAATLPKLRTRSPLRPTPGPA